MNRPLLFQGILPIHRQEIPRDILAGITLAALGIPEVMGYTKISQTPIVTGLYTLLLPVIAFALLGASRHLVVAADSATAAILAATLASVATPGGQTYVNLTRLVALTVAIMLFIAFLFRLGFLADFLSRSALIGFLTGVGVQVAVGELSGLLGLPKEGHGSLGQIWSVVDRLGGTHVATLILSLVVLLVIVVFDRFAPKVPGALLAVTGAIVTSAVFDFAGRGIQVVGSVPGGLPSLSLPPVDRSAMAQVAATAASCFIVILAQSAATARAYAVRYNERSNDNVDLIGLTGANASAAFTGTFVVNGSPTKTEMVDEAGGRSQLAHLTTAAIVLLVLLFLTKPLGYLPSAVLSAIVFRIGIRLIDIRGLEELFRLQRNEFVIALATTATVVFASVMAGIGVAVVLSLVEHVRHTYRPRTRLLIRSAGGEWHAVPVAPGLFAAPGIVVYRFEANLFYANAGKFVDELASLGPPTQPSVRWIVADTSGIDDVDYSAAKALLQIRPELERRGVRFASVAASEALRDELSRYGLGVGPQARIFSSVQEAVDAIEAGRT
jgi:high affinity sulfate transporter 1